MKNKLLAITIASALSTVWSSQLLAENNEMTVTQQNSLGGVTATQGNETSDSTITIIQKDSDATSSIMITQDGAINSDTTINQYKGAELGTASTISITQSGGSSDAPNTVNVQQGMDGVDQSNDGNTFNITTQAGSGNSIIGYAAQIMGDYVASDAADGASFATQTGVANTATLSQQGSNNVIGFAQNGSENTVKLDQDAMTSDSTMNVSLSGDGILNFVDVEQVATTNSDMNVIMSSDAAFVDNNSINAYQAASESSMMISIDGSGNSATLTQDFEATLGSDMMLAQAGNDNTALMGQYADGNTMSLNQTGDSNMATMNQYGTNDTMTVSQDGSATAMLEQGNVAP